MSQTHKLGRLLLEWMLAAIGLAFIGSLTGCLPILMGVRQPKPTTVAQSHAFWIRNVDANWGQGPARYLLFPDSLAVLASYFREADSAKSVRPFQLHLFDRTGAMLARLADCNRRTMDIEGTFLAAPIPIVAQDVRSSQVYELHELLTQLRLPQGQHFSASLDTKPYWLVVIWARWMYPSFRREQAAIADFAKRINPDSLGVLYVAFEYIQ